MTRPPEPTVALRALEHHAYCPRQCTLIHGDRVWEHNEHTTHGVRAHRRVDAGEQRVARGVRTLRSVPLWSEALGLSGRSDVIELHQDGSVIPVEYKAGTRHGDAADLQLCGQALCLEEMLGIAVHHGFVWFGAPRRRSRVLLDADLRRRTLRAIDAIRSNLLADQLPAAPNDQRCRQCQLLHHCLPEIVSVDSLRLRRETTEELFRCDT